MDSRQISAALGFTLLIACVLGIVILIHNSGTSRRSSSSSSQTPFPHSTSHHHPHVISKWNENQKANRKEGFVNDPNYHPEQPTMQEVNELADELHRFLSQSKSKHVQGKPSQVNGSMLTKPMMKNGAPLLSSLNHNGSSSNSQTHKLYPSNSSSSSSSSLFQSATSSGTTKKASISVINYSSVPNGNSNNNRQQEKRRYLTPPSTKQQQQQQTEFQHFQPLPYPGHQSPPEKSQADIELGGLTPNDLYTTSWLPSMISPGSRNIVPLGHSPSSQNTNNKIKNPPQSPPPRHNHNNNDISNHKGKMNENGGGSNENGYSRRNNNNNRHTEIHGQVQHHLRYPHNETSKGAPKQSSDKEEDEIDDDGEEEEYEDEEEYEYEDDLSEENVEQQRGNDLKRKDKDNLDQTHDHDRDHDDDDHLNEEEEEDDQLADDENAEPKNFAAELETLFELANHLYTSGVANLSSSSLSSAPVFQTFFKVINETIQKSSNSRLLADLNDMYEAPTNSRNANKTKFVNETSGAEGRTTKRTNSTSSLLQMRKDSSANPYEKSLTAFVFMSFGIFLLNQIHSFVQKAETHSNSLNHSMDASGHGRSYFEPTGFDWFLDPGGSIPEFVAKEPSALDILFDSPGMRKENDSDLKQENDMGTRTRSFPLIQEVDLSKTTTSTDPYFHENDDVNNNEWSSRAASSSSDPQDIISTFSSSHHLNNMFRAMLNIANAYTRDSKALECIWSLYCQDLDATAGKQGLYGVAARINSVGLRLIMNQIPPSLTLDVILRSLVGWDGLPCRKMFPECTVGNGTISMVSNSSNVTGAQFTHNNLR